MALQSVRFDPQQGPGEHRLPSIVAPGGGVIHFVDAALGARLFETDFHLDPVAADDAPASRLIAIDHVAMALAPDRVDTWVLFCRAVLGMEAGDRMDLPDPYGLVRNFGMADEQRRLRLVLNVSPSQRTRTAKVASGRGGAVVHHIAMSCEDIFETTTALRDRGVRFVPISGNYYDDLPTRFELSPEFRRAAARAPASCSTAARTATTCMPTRSRSPADSSSRSSSESAATTPTVPPMPRRAWRRRPRSIALWMSAEPAGPH